MCHQPQIVFHKFGAGGGIAETQAVKAIALLGRGKRTGKRSGSGNVQNKEKETGDGTGKKSSQHERYLRGKFGRSPVIKASYAQGGLFVASPAGCGRHTGEKASCVVRQSGSFWGKPHPEKGVFCR